MEDFIWFALGSGFGLVLGIWMMFKDKEKS